MFFLCCNGPNRTQATSLLNVDVSRSITIGRTTPYRSPLNEWSARRRGSYVHNTQQTPETNSRALSGIRPRSRSRPTP